MLVHTVKSLGEQNYRQTLFTHDSTAFNVIIIIIHHLLDRKTLKYSRYEKISIIPAGFYACSVAGDG